MKQFDFSKIYKSLFYLSQGIIGVAKNKHIPFLMKITLYSDYFRLLLTASTLPFNAKLSNKKFDKVFYTRAFNYKIHYPIFQSFLFSFNEVFGIETYPAVLNLKKYVDLGSNIGVPILWYHFLNPEMEIYAFEPDPHIFKLLKKNIKEAKIKNCHLFNKGVSDKVGEFKFYQILDPIQNLDNGLTLNMELPFETTLVKIEKLSPLIKTIRNVSLIKMDIEGEEYNVFNDLLRSNTIDKIDKIFFESHIFKNIAPKNYLELLKKIGKIGEVKSRVNSKLSSINYWIKN